MSRSSSSLPRESILEQFGQDFVCLDCYTEFRAEYKAVAHFSYVHLAVEEAGRLPGKYHITTDDEPAQTTHNTNKKHKEIFRSQASIKTSNIFYCKTCGFVPETKERDEMYKHYVLCLPDFRRNLHSFYPTFLYPSNSSFSCPLCEKKFYKRNELEIHLGCVHMKVEPYLPKQKVITDQKLERWKRDHGNGDAIEHSVLSHENKVSNPTEKAINLNEMPAQEAVINDDAKLNKDCSQIVLEEAIDSSDGESDEEDNVPKPVQECVENHDKPEETNGTNNSEDSSDSDSDDDDGSQLIDIETNLPEELNDETKAVMDDTIIPETTNTLKAKLPASQTKCKPLKSKKIHCRRWRPRGAALKAPGVLYCLCRRPYLRADGPMVGCDGQCQDWYHFSCLGLGPAHRLAPGPWYCGACRGP